MSSLVIVWLHRLPLKRSPARPGCRTHTGPRARSARSGSPRGRGRRASASAAARNASSLPRASRTARLSACVAPSAPAAAPSFRSTASTITGSMASRISSSNLVDAGGGAHSGPRLPLLGEDVGAPGAQRPDRQSPPRRPGPPAPRPGGARRRRPEAPLAAAGKALERLREAGLARLKRLLHRAAAGEKRVQRRAGMTGPASRSASSTCW